MAHIDYFVLKNYKGLFVKRHRGNTHAFYIPLGNGLTGYFGLLGRVNGESLDDGNDTDEYEYKDTYAMVLIFKMEDDLLERIQDAEEKYFGDRYVHLESVDGDSQLISRGYFNFKIDHPGKYIHSDIRTKFMPEYSSNDKKIYFVYGGFDFETQDIKTNQLRGYANKTFMNMTNKNFSNSDDVLDLLQHENENLTESFDDFLDKGRYLLMLKKRSQNCKEKTDQIMDRHKRAYAYNMCQAAAAKKTITELSALIGQCNAAKNPEKCKERIADQIDKWRILYQEFLVKVAKSRVND